MTTAPAPPNATSASPSVDQPPPATERPALPHPFEAMRPVQRRVLLVISILVLGVSVWLLRSAIAELAVDGVSYGSFQRAGSDVGATLQVWQDASVTTGADQVSNAMHALRLDIWFALSYGIGGALLFGRIADWLAARRTFASVGAVLFSLAAWAVLVAGTFDVLENVLLLDAALRFVHHESSDVPGSAAWMAGNVKWAAVVVTAVGVIGGLALQGVSRTRSFHASWRDRPFIDWAHRGGDEHGPAQTLAAFVRAASLDSASQIAVGLEMDVRLSGDRPDGTLVVHHDPTAPGVNDGRRYRISRTSAADLRANADVPTLAEVLTACPGPPKTIELKGAGRAGARALAELLGASFPEQEVIVTSFWPTTLKAFRTAASSAGLEVTTSASTPGVIWFWLRSFLGVPAVTSRHVALQVPAFFANGHVIESAHGADVAIHVWTINEPGKMRDLIADGVDGIITDKPEALIREAARTIVR